jgi:hypothetical protein
MNTETKSKLTEDKALSLRNISLTRAHLAVGEALSEVWQVKNDAKMVTDSGDELDTNAEKIREATVADLSIIERRLEKIQTELVNVLRETFEAQKARMGKK